MTRGRLLTLSGYYSFILIGWNSVLMASLIRSLEHDFHQSDAGFALLYLLQALVYASGAFFSGLLTERVGRKPVLLVAAALPVPGMLIGASAGSWPVLVAAMVPVSWGAGAIDGGINGLFLDLNREGRGGALTQLHGFFSIGALVAPFVAGVLVAHGASWRLLLLITAVEFSLLLPLLALLPMPHGLHVPHAHHEEAAGLGVAERSLLPFVGLALAIGLYVAAEDGVSRWVVRYLTSSPVAVATGVLSLFWGGLTVGRLCARWITERVDYFVFTWTSFALASTSLAVAVAVPWVPVKAVAFTLTGLFYGPIFPMIIALGGNIYPHRLAALSGSLTTSAVAGSVVYPPLMGVLASRIGLTGGLIGAALLGIPAAAGIIVARRASRGAMPDRAEVRAG